MESTSNLLTDLNEQQKEAVICSDKRLLVLAGAGSGKTKTLTKKIAYLVFEQHIPSSNIMAITFTKNAANEMIDRLIEMADTTCKYKEQVADKKTTQKQKDQLRLTYTKQFKWINNLTLCTFHSFCYKILRKHSEYDFDNKFKILAEDRGDDEEISKINAKEKPSEVIHKALVQCIEDRDYLIKLKRYILDYYVDRIDSPSLKNEKFNFSKPYTTLKGDKVRSKSERDIADWLYRHDIEYKYEPKECFKKFEFTPDFHLLQADIFIEHVTDKSYKMKDKEEEFQEANRTLIKTYEYMMKDTSIFNKEMERIIKNRLSDNYKPQSIVTFDLEFKNYHKELKDFLRDATRVIDKIKVENKLIKDVREKAACDQHERVRIFYELVIPLYENYKKYCINKSYLDFNDLILETLNLFKNNPEVKERYQKQFKHIMVDEFQDVNKCQVELINYLITPDSFLFCVGDDWQSIYGFRGSEVDYIINFGEYFPPARIIKLVYNYRSTQHIVNASNEVIKKNKYKLDKDLKAKKESDIKINLFQAPTYPKEGVSFVINTIKKLLNEGYKQDEIVILYRRTDHYEQFKNELKKENLKISGKTIHSAKGLEAKIIFIIGLIDGNNGFPNVFPADRIMQVLKKVNYDILMEEERRLFYVAMTRAKEELYLISEEGAPSSFISEIPPEYYIQNQYDFSNSMEQVLLCPECKKAIRDFDKFCSACGAKL